MNSNHIQNKNDIKKISLNGDRTINLTDNGLVSYPPHYENAQTNVKIFYYLFASNYLYNSINSYLKISLLLVNIYNNTDCQQRQNIAVAL